MTPNSFDISSRIGFVLEQNAPRILFQDDKVAFSGQEIQDKITALGQLIDRATNEGDSVAICFPNLAVQAVVMLAVLSAKRVPVLLSYTESSEDIKNWVLRSQAALIILPSGFDTQIEDYVQFLGLDNQATVLQSFIGIPKLNTRDTRSAPPEGTALILFTSGSTGEPKGICVPTEGILKTADHLINYFNLNESTVSPIVLPICHSMALNTQFFPTFFAGGKSIFINSRLSINKIYRTILSINGTFVSLIGEVLGACWEEKKRRELAPAYHVRHVQLAGGMITSKHISMAKQLFPYAKIHKGYGLTEAIRVTMINSDDENFLTGAVGYPLPFLEVQIRNSEQVVTAANEVGEIFVRGASVLKGFVNHSLRHQKTIVDANGFLSTGDFGQWNEVGQLCVVGREDSLYKINGHRVSGHEIEKIAFETSDAIKSARCVAVEDQLRFDGKKLVLMLEIAAENQNALLSSMLPEMHQKMWDHFRSLSYFPREVIVMQKFPRTSNGKVDLKQLNTMYMVETKSNLMHLSHSSLQFFQMSSTETDGYQHEAN